MLALKIVLLVIGAYLFGNINFAMIFSRKLKNRDITHEGSGNPGTMNMFRTFGLKIALLTLFFEALKGVIPALIGMFLLKGDGLSTLGVYAAGLAVILGHNFPVFYKFKGGKGVAASWGVFLVANPIWALLAFVVGVLVVVVCDMGSLGSMAYLVFFTVGEAFHIWGDLASVILLFVIFALIVFMHRSNIKRIVIGKESRMHFVDKIKDTFKKEKPKEDDMIVDVEPSDLKPVDKEDKNKEDKNED